MTLYVDGNKVVLEIICSSCKGTGGIRHSGGTEVRKCPDCDGSGLLLNDNGREIVAFMKRHKTKF